ncbi:MAG: leucine-rich repeat protein [Clostridia bacterium]|nr:leucine-rich repeat protein [Clostridia bacterium]
MKTKLQKLVSFVLTLTLIASLASVSFTSLAADELTLADVEAFGKELASVIGAANTANENAEADEESDDVSAQEEKSYEATRLIVKASDELDDMGAVSKVEGLLDLHIFQYKNEEDAKKAYESFKADSDVDWVEYDKIVKSSSVEPTVDEAWLTAGGDNYLSWGADYMGVESFTEELLSEDLETVTVAVVDTGIDTDHPLFGGFYDEASNPEGRILRDGANFSDSNNAIPFEDDMSHGTHVSGTIVDLTLSNVKILPVKVLNAFGSGYTSTISAGILYAAAYGAPVVNCSLGNSDIDSFVEEYVVNIAYDLGSVVVAAAGNESMNAEWSDPGSSEKCITVGSLDNTLSLSYFSNYGNTVDVCAPGEDILSACIGGGYIFFDGTSMAAPHVSAAAALYLSKDPSLTPDSLTDAITSNAVDLGEEGKDYLYGYGLAFAQADSLRNLGQINFSLSDNDVTLSCSGSDSVYYTTDGTNPLRSKSATLYNGTFTVENTLRLRAVAFNKSKQPGQSLPLTKDIFIEDTSPEYRIFNNGSIIVKATGILPEAIKITSAYTGIGDYAFAGHQELFSVELPSNITTLGEGAFLACTLNEVSLPGVKTIGTLALAETSIEALDAPSAQTVGNSAFAYSYLEDISLPNATAVGEYAFYLANINNLDLSKVEKVGNGAFKEMISHGSFDIYNAKEAGDYAFYAAYICNDLMLPLLRQAGRYSFSYTECVDYESEYGFAEISLSSLENAGDYAFYACFSPISVPKLKTAGDYTFAGCYLLTTEFPYLETAGDAAFVSASVEDVFSFPKLTTIGDHAFEGAFAFDFYLPMLKTAGDYAFYGIATDSEHLDLPKLETAGDYAFAYTYICTFNLPNLKVIGNNGFDWCEATRIDLPSIESIGSMAFANLDFLNGIKLPDSIKYIGPKVFGDNSEKALIGKSGSYAESYAKENDYRFITVDTEFTVTFVNARGRAVNTQKVRAGESAVEPKGPFAFAKTFLGWDTDTSFVTEDLTVYPIYESVFETLYMRIIFFFLDLFGVVYY